jgi:hypothetical protein
LKGKDKMQVGKNAMAEKSPDRISGDEGMKFHLLQSHCRNANYRNASLLYRRGGAHVQYCTAQNKISTIDQ